MSKYLVMFSGGLDSTGLLWHLLDSEQQVHVHHMIYLNRQSEDVAARRIVDWLHDTGYKFDYTESTIDVPRINGVPIRNMDCLNLIGGFLCSQMPEIQYIAVGMQAGDGRRPGWIERGATILNAMTEGRVQKVYPVIGKSRKELYESLPKPLKEMFWSCMAPGAKTPCGTCSTCKELREAGVPHPERL
jgi:7-cyano-7-deazaguanine synthase in queuosine biosynthesis